MDIANRIYTMPPFTKYFLTMMLVTTTLINIVPQIPTFFYFAFSIKKINQEYQVWRFITNYLIGGKFSINFVFLLYSLFNNLTHLEKEARSKKKFPDFIGTIIYQCFFITIGEYIWFYVFHIKESRSLLNELSYSFYAMDSYRDPERETRVMFMLPVKNKYSPFVMVFFDITSGSDPSKMIIGLIAGYLICFLNDFMIEKFGITLLFLPNTLKKWLAKEELVVEKKKKKEKDNEEFMPMERNDNTNVAYRERGNVIEGNEYVPSGGNRGNEVTWD